MSYFCFHLTGRVYVFVCVFVAVSRGSSFKGRGRKERKGRKRGGREENKGGKRVGMEEK